MSGSHIYICITYKKRSAKSVFSVFFFTNLVSCPAAAAVSQAKFVEIGGTKDTEDFAQNVAFLFG